MGYAHGIYQTFSMNYLYQILNITISQDRQKGEYILHANGHTLRIVRNDNLSQGDVVNLKSLNKVFIYYDDVRTKSVKKVAQYSYETDQRLDTIEKNIETIQTSAKSTANIYHRMMIDDWSKELVLTNYGTEKVLSKRLLKLQKQE